MNDNFRKPEDGQNFIIHRIKKGGWSNFIYIIEETKT